MFDPSEVAILHICARVVRRCLLFGVDPVTGKNHCGSFRLSGKTIGTQRACLALAEKHNDPQGKPAVFVFVLSLRLCLDFDYFDTRNRTGSNEDCNPFRGLRLATSRFLLHKGLLKMPAVNLARIVCSSSSAICPLSPTPA